MLPFLLLFSFISIILAFEPPCSSCKHFISNNKGNLDLGLCKMFTNKLSLKGDDVALPNFARHCRNDEQLCGKFGFLYEPANNNNNNNNATETTNSTIREEELVNEYEELKNRCCGEVNEDDELEQLERDFFEVFQKIKRHNRKRVYKTSQELYKLFKKK